MRLFLAMATLCVATYAKIPVPQILTVEQTQQIEAAVANEPGDLHAQKLLGQSYALFLLGVTSFSQNGLVDQIDSAKSRSEFAQHARQALMDSTLPMILGECGLALWDYRYPAYPSILKVSPQESKDAEQLAVGLLNRAIALKPDQVQWRSRRLGMTESQVKFGRMKADEGYALAQADFAALSGTQRTLALGTQAELALRARQVEEAEGLARESLKVALSSPDTWNTGNAIHTANRVLGQTALQRGDLNAAGEYLLASARTPGSPQLGSFGPNMSLALALLKAGQREVVLQYFDLCRNFWKMGGDRLTQWSTEVNAGVTPQFGANLIY